MNQALIMNKFNKVLVYENLEEFTAVK